jgi:hypothetical protein
MTILRLFKSSTDVRPLNAGEKFRMWLADRAGREVSVTVAWGYRPLLPLMHLRGELIPSSTWFSASEMSDDHRIGEFYGVGGAFLDAGVLAMHETLIWPLPGNAGEVARVLLPGGGVLEISDQDPLATVTS